MIGPELLANVGQFQPHVNQNGFAVAGLDQVAEIHVLLRIRFVVMPARDMQRADARLAPAVGKIIQVDARTIGTVEECPEPLAAEGRIQAFVAAYAILRPQIQNGKVKVLALTNRERAAALPNIPAAAEVGYPSLNFEGLIGLLGPRNMPLAIRERIAADISDIASDPALPGLLNTIGQVLNPGTPEEFAAALDDQRVTVAKIGEALGIKPAQ